MQSQCEKLCDKQAEHEKTRIVKVQKLKGVK